MDAKYLREDEFIKMLNKNEWIIRSASIISRFCSETYDQSNDIKEIKNLHTCGQKQKHVSITNHHDFYSYVFNNFTKDRLEEKIDVYNTLIRIKETYDHIGNKSEIEEIHFTISCDYMQPHYLYELHNSTIGNEKKDHVYETLYVYLSKDDWCSRCSDY